MYWRVALLVLLTTVVPQAKAEPPVEQHYVCSITTARLLG